MSGRGWLPETSAERSPLKNYTKNPYQILLGIPYWQWIILISPEFRTYMNEVWRKFSDKPSPPKLVLPRVPDVSILSIDLFGKVSS